jgi:hypothetical protein
MSGVSGAAGVAAVAGVADAGAEVLFSMDPVKQQRGLSGKHPA